MKTVELKEIVGYLPYGLKVLSRETIFEMDIYSNMRGSGIEKRDIQSVISSKMKPILLPLSMLNQEIEVNGEKFVPIVELAKIEANGISGGHIFDIKEFRRGMSFSSSQMGVSFKIKHRGTDPETGKDYYCYNEIMIYEKTPLTFFKKKISKPYFVGGELGIQNLCRPYELFQKLYEWHFDIHGLIEKGLAIDKTTLK